jgi:hypothetical protein
VHQAIRPGQCATQVRSLRQVTDGDLLHRGSVPATDTANGRHHALAAPVEFGTQGAADEATGPGDDDPLHSSPGSAGGRPAG